MQLSLLAKLAAIDCEVDKEASSSVGSCSVGSCSVAPIPKFISFPSQTTTMSTAQRKGNSPNYSHGELMSLLHVLEVELPIGEMAWKKVAQRHAETFPHRTVQSIRRKFTSLHRKSIPTGNPQCPPEVKLAKRVHYLLGDKASIGDGEEEFVLEELKCGESGANPKSCAQTAAEEEAAAAPPPAASAPEGVPNMSLVNMSSVTQSTPVAKRAHNSSSAKKEEWADILRANIEAEREERKMRREEREEERRDRQLHLEQERIRRAEEKEEERIRRAEERADERAFQRQQAEERALREEQKDDRLMKMVALALGAFKDGRPQAAVRNSVPLGIDLDDGEVVPLVSNKRPRRRLGRK